MIAVGVAGSQGATVAQTYGAQRIASAPGLRQIVVPAIERYGPIFLVGAVASAAVLIVLDRTRNRTVTFPELWLSSQYMTGVVLAVFSIVTFTALLAYNPIRNSRYALLIATMLAGLMIAWLLHSRMSGSLTRQRFVTSIIVGLLLLSVPVAVTNSYYPHMHLTHTEEDGTEWFYEHFEPNSNAVSHGVTVKMQLYVQGGQPARLVFSDIGSDSSIPRYLGYRTNDTLGETVGGEQTYLVTKTYDREFLNSLKPYLRSENTVYTERTLHRLEDDATANRVYANGGYTVWWVNGTSVPASA
jgi:hypothetical protein